MQTKTYEKIEPYYENSEYKNIEEVEQWWIKSRKIVDYNKANRIDWEMA